MKRMLFTFLLALPGALHAQNKPFALTGKVAHPTAVPQKVFLRYEAQGPENTTINVVDSATIKNGIFTFKGAIKEPTRAVIHYDMSGRTQASSSDFVPIYLTPGNVSLSAQDSLQYAVITGPKVVLDFERLKAVQQAAQQRFIYVTSQGGYDSARNQEGTDYYNFARKNPNSLISLEGLALAESVMGADFAVTTPIFNSFSPAVKNSTKGLVFADRIKKEHAIIIGNIAPDFNTQLDPDGKPLKPSDFRGKYLLIDFWASWCGPCVKENPFLVAAYKTYHEKGLEILGVSLDSYKEDWLEGIQKDSLPWQQVADLKKWKNDAAALYDVKAIPQNFLLDPTGKIIAKNLRGEALDQKLVEIFGKQ